jgi:Bacterial PH domain
VQAWSIETAGTFDRDCELEDWYSGLGKMRLEFAGSVDVHVIGRIIGDHVL